MRKRETYLDSREGRRREEKGSEFNILFSSAPLPSKERAETAAVKAELILATC